MTLPPDFRLPDHVEEVFAVMSHLEASGLNITVAACVERGFSTERVLDAWQYLYEVGFIEEPQPLP